MTHTPDHEPAHSLREDLYREYVSTHAGLPDIEATSLFVRRVLAPLLPKTSPGSVKRVLELGAGSGQVVAVLSGLGFDAIGVDDSSEQVELADQSVVLGDARTFLASHEPTPHAIIAIDFLEHLSRAEALDLLKTARRRLERGGVFIARLPNAESPFFGRLQFGDLSHETAFTQRSIRQLLHVAGFPAADVFAVNPVVHGPLSASRYILWSTFAAIGRLALAAETGLLRGHIVTQNMMVVARV